MIDHTACCGDHPVVGADGSSQIFRYPIFFCSNRTSTELVFFLIRCISYPLKYLQKVYIEEATKTKFKTFIFASMMLRSQHLWRFPLQAFLGVTSSPVGPFPKLAGRVRLPHVSRGEPGGFQREQGNSWKLPDRRWAIRQFGFAILKRFFCCWWFPKMFLFAPLFLGRWLKVETCSHMFFMHFFPVRSFWTLKNSIPF